MTPVTEFNHRGHREESEGDEVSQFRTILEFSSETSFQARQAASRLSDLEVRVKFLLEKPTVQKGQPPDILLNRHFVPKNDPKSVFFLREAEFQQPA
jgi:hypothetical protein